ncbi:MAG: hypothetical protein IPN89_14130 [Saprospiraceae bacterium]|nr:hypothetical protein [Saprospiraceae bacterium]
MKNVFKFLFVTIFLCLSSGIDNHLDAQAPTYNQFRVVTEAWQISNFINDTPDQDPVYMVLAPGDYRIAQPITIDRVGAVYIHGLSTGSTHLSDSTGFSGSELFIVKRTQKFSLSRS